MRSASLAGRLFQNGPEFARRIGFENDDRVQMKRFPKAGSFPRRTPPLAKLFLRAGEAFIRGRLQTGARIALVCACMGYVWR